MVDGVHLKDEAQRWRHGSSRPACVNCPAPRNQSVISRVHQLPINAEDE